MTRRYTDHRVLADDIVRDPGFYGVGAYVPSPCCEREVRITFHERQLDTSFVDGEEALTYLRGLTQAVERLLREIGDNPVWDSGPCMGCIRDGNVDPRWLERSGETLESLRADRYYREHYGIDA